MKIDRSATNVDGRDSKVELAAKSAISAVYGTLVMVEFNIFSSTAGAEMLIWGWKIFS